MRLYTIGHNAHPIEKFLGLLEAYGIRRLVDVRSAPYSRYQPHFNKNKLDGALLLRGMGYIFSGETLGGRPADPRWRPTSKVSWGPSGLPMLRLCPSRMSMGGFQRSDMSPPRRTA